MTGKEQQIAAIVSHAFLACREIGYQPMDINALVLGMIHKSIEDIIGKSDAADFCTSAMKNIGWFDDQS